MFRNVMYEFDPSLSTYKEPREKGAKSAWCYSKDAIPIQIGTGMSTHERFSFGHLVILFIKSQAPESKSNPSTFSRKIRSSPSTTRRMNPRRQGRDLLHRMYCTVFHQAPTPVGRFENPLCVRGTGGDHAKTGSMHAASQLIQMDGR